LFLLAYFDKYFSMAVFLLQSVILNKTKYKKCHGIIHNIILKKVF